MSYHSKKKKETTYKNALTSQNADPYNTLHKKQVFIAVSFFKLDAFITNHVISNHGHDIGTGVEAKKIANCKIWK